ncbi:3607_t:CDS:2 [Gigaspora margarita]|uniref:3607_t:CDS:1 n=1 Tax=Gigaspora margarita TaxID=4874 RepID=A0ABN7VAL8_GIGMA|nr:3607_t:CDS:2 [Gigaspora margarita]
MWYKYLEEYLMIDSSSRKIDPKYQTALPNNLASRLVLDRLQTDKRLREVIYFKTRNSSIELEKVLKKGECCVLNTLKDSQSCIGHFSKHAIIRTIPLSEKLREKDQLCLPFSIFENACRENESTDHLRWKKS